MSDDAKVAQAEGEDMDGGSRRSGESNTGFGAGNANTRRTNAIEIDVERVCYCDDRGDANVGCGDCQLAGNDAYCEKHQGMYCSGTCEGGYM